MKPVSTPNFIPSLLLGTLIGGIAALSVLQTIVPILTATLTANGKGFWHISRVTGIAAYILLSLSMVYGLLFSSRAHAPASSAALLSLHRFVALLALGLSALHALVLVGDAYLHPSIGQLLAPFMLPHPKWWWIGLGQTALYALLLIIVGFYLRGILGTKPWRVLHFAVFMTYLLVTLHSFFTGSDTRTLPVLLTYALCNSTVVALITLRILRKL